MFRRSRRVGARAFALFIGLGTCGALGAGCSDAEPEVDEIEFGTVRSGLEAVAAFGTNPGQLTMKKYVPDGMPNTPRPLVVALHGCSQTPDAYASAGWNDLADAWKFYVVYPGQNNAKNNSLGCFNWGGRWPSAPNAFVFKAEPLDLTELQRGHGENQSIKEMVDHMKASHAVDASRVYVTGLSAGGGMTAVMLATWPDVFAGGSIMAGIPYGCAMNKKTTEEANACLRAYTGTAAYLSRSPSAWGDLVRSASPHKGAFPRVSIWAGTADGTVAPSIVGEHVKQWTNVHGTDTTPDVSNDVDGSAHKEYKDATGKVVVETFEVTGKPHGAMVAPQSPVDPAMANGPKCGKAGSFIVSAGICSAYHSAKFFGLGPPGTEPPPGTTLPGATPGSANAGTTGTNADGTTGGKTGKGRVWVPGSAGSTCAIGAVPSTQSSALAMIALGALAAALVRRRRS